MSRFILMCVVALGLASTAEVAAVVVVNEGAEHTRAACVVRSVYVAKLGDTGLASDFRSALQTSLRRKFDLAERADGANAVLTGKFSVTRSKGKKVRFEDARLTTKTGEQLWEGSFYWESTSVLTLRRSVVSTASENVAGDVFGKCQPAPDR